MDTLEDIAYEVGLLVNDKGIICSEWIENTNYEVYFIDLKIKQKKCIEVIKKRTNKSMFYLQKDIPKLIEFLENNNFLI